VSETYVYRLLKSSWGVRVAITGTSEDLPPGPDGVTSCGLVSTGFSGGAAKLADELREEIVAGLSMIRREISESRGGAAVSVTIQEVKFNEADFQVDGLRAAAIRWAEMYFGLPEHLIGEDFDKSSNRYIFDFTGTA
jgi:hypothetical protein